ncbi:hypothetical protein, partial [Escherichia coli]|uniref:hypothetical protein n=1 Tax=Escherichia coli TaxID=562 RepID=UPI0032D9BBE9
CFSNIVTTISYVFLPAMNKNPYAAFKNIYRSGDDSLPHSVIAWKMLPTQSTFHQPKQAEVRRHQIQT